MGYKNVVQANQELKRLRALNDGKNYIITFTRGGVYTVGERTEKQEKYISSMSKKEQNMKISDWLEQERVRLYGNH
tara:strand:- start:1662 stop:1889 length:228 start_codon:yes stop_codon:yes gene_type:complete